MYIRYFLVIFLFKTVDAFPEYFCDSSPVDGKDWCPITPAVGLSLQTMGVVAADTTGLSIVVTNAATGASVATESPYTPGTSYNVKISSTGYRFNAQLADTISASFADTTCCSGQRVANDDMQGGVSLLVIKPTATTDVVITMIYAPQLGSPYMPSAFTLKAPAAPAPEAPPSPSPSQVPVAAPTLVPIATPTALPTASPTTFPTVSPTEIPIAIPTAGPTVTPLASPTTIPSFGPTTVPIASPTTNPSNVSTPKPSATPTVGHTAESSVRPTDSPSGSSTTFAPTENPTVEATKGPTVTPNAIPTISPTAPPTLSPTFVLSKGPTVPPTVSPTEVPTALVVPILTLLPMGNPTAAPVVAPSLPVSSTRAPSIAVHPEPIAFPTVTPTASPTVNPTALPSVSPTTFPTSIPTAATTSFGVTQTVNGVSRTNFTALVSSVFDSSVSSFLGPTVKNVTILTVVNAQPAAKRRTLESEAVIVSYLIQSFGASLTSSQLRAYLNGGKNNTSLTMVLEKNLLAQNFDSVTYALYSGITVSSNAVVEVVTPSPSASPTKFSPSSAPAEVVAASAGTKSTPQDNTPYIVGPIVGVVGCILLSGIFFWCYRSRSNSNRRLSHSSVGVVAEDSHVA